jgi:hypothetical protein
MSNDSSSIALILKPILRMLLLKGMQLQSIVAAIKESLVQVAQEELKAQGATASVSRISVMTGIYRKEIQKLINQDIKIGERIPLLVKIVGQWREHPKFSKPRGVPRSLDCIGKESEFVKLVYSINREVNPYAVLFELERLGLVKNQDGEVELLSAEVIPEKNIDEAIRLIADDLQDLAEIVPSNLLCEKKIPQLHLKTAYDNITEDSLPEIRLWILKEGAEFHRKLRDFLSQFDKDLNPLLKNSKGSKRVALGTFAIIPEDTETINCKMDKEKS